MKTVCSSSLAYVAEAFGTIGEVEVMPGREICAEHLRNADILAVRSTTRVDQDLLQDTGVTFVGSATIGTDHLDLEYLEQNDIAWAVAPGSNADSASEYVLSALLHVASARSELLFGRTIGIVGLGNIGRRVARKALGIGMNVLACDPPLQENLSKGSVAEAERDAIPDVPFVTQDTLLESSDIITLHVPLTSAGAYSTQAMASARFLARMRSGAWFVNMARGAVMDTEALIPAIRGEHLACAIVDTWENEPLIDRRLLSLAALGTPHVAGYSLDGRINGTQMIYEAACRHYKVPLAWAPPDRPSEQMINIRLEPGIHEMEALLLATRATFDIGEDDRQLRAGMSLPDAEWARHFDALRANYPTRREFSTACVVVAPGVPGAVVQKLHALGFSCIQDSDPRSLRG